MWSAMRSDAVTGRLHGGISVRASTAGGARRPGLAAAAALLGGVLAAGTAGAAEWVATGAGNSLLAEDGLFAVETVDGEPALVTSSTDTNIHAHCVDASRTAPLVFTGELRCDDPEGGLGVTFLSRYPYSDHYYRLRRYGTGDFLISPHGTSASGDVRSGLVPLAAVWYDFRVEVEDTGSRTEIRARVWPADETEPSGWQMECYDASTARLTEGVFGVWSMGPGRKLWRRLAVNGESIPLPGEEEAGTETTSTDGTDSGTVVARWLDTGDGNSLVKDDALFEAVASDGYDVLRTLSEETNIHSHLVTDEELFAGSLSFRGEMRGSDGGSGFGVTFLSRYPEADHYYRLRRYGRNGFHIAPHGTSVEGDTKTDVVPEGGTWYAFRIDVQDTGQRTEILAKVWPRGASEPAEWQIACYDASDTRLTAGAVGVWSMGSGSKEWRTLEGNGVALPIADGDLAIEWGSSTTDSTGSTDDTTSGDTSTTDSTTSTDDTTSGDTSTTDDTTSTDGSTSDTSDAETTDDYVVEDDPVEVDYPPTIAIVVEGDEEVDGGLRLFFRADASDPESELAPEAVSWSFGDGDTATGFSVDHVFAPGTWLVRAEVEDPGGATAADELEVEVLEPVEDLPAVPVRWVDTAAGNSLEEDDTLFAPVAVDGGTALRTDSTDTNIHSHAVLEDGGDWGSMRFRGEMRGDASTSGLGVTFLSAYPGADQYYRLRRYNDGAFLIAPHGTAVEGDVHTSVVPQAGVWYAFLIEVVDTGTRTDIRAKVWEASAEEPELWQIDCWDASSTRRTRGTVGVWAMGAGAKLWREFAVNGRALPFEGELESVPAEFATSFEDGDPALPLDLGPWQRRSDAALARTGTASLETGLGSEVSLAEVFPGPFTDFLASWLFADEVHGRAWVLWDTALTGDPAAVRPGLDEFLAAQPDALTAEETATAGALVSEIEARGLPAVEGGVWHCLTLSHVYPADDGTPGRLTVTIDGRVLIDMEGFDASRDLRALDAVLQTLRYRAAETDPASVRVDDVRISVAPVPCDG